MTANPAIQRATIARDVQLSGLGVMSGAQIAVSLHPADTGITVTRTDTGKQTHVSPATAHVGMSWSAVGEDDAQVCLVEHLMAALAATGITDVDIRVSGPEIPLLDGSAHPWVELLGEAGRQSLDSAIEPLRATGPMTVARPDEGKLLAAMPYNGWRVVYVLDVPHCMIGFQTAAFEVGKDDFADALAWARTFALAEDARAARDAGIFPAGTEENVVVVYDDHLSAPLKAPDAFARHKLVDLIGDLYLAGRPLQGLFIGYNSTHAMNHELLAQLAIDV